MSRMNVTAAVEPAYRHMVSLLFEPFYLDRWFAFGFAALLGGYLGYGSGIQLSGGFFGIAAQYGERALNWIIGDLDFAISAGVLALTLLLLLFWLGSIFQLVYTSQIVEDSDAIDKPFARLKSLGTSFFLWKAGIWFLPLVTFGILIVPVLGSDVSMWAHVKPNGWLVALFSVFSIVLSTVDYVADGLIPGVMYARKVRVLEAWRLLLPRIRENISQVVLYFLLRFVFSVAYVIILIFAAVVSLIVLAVPFIIAVALTMNGYNGLDMVIWAVLEMAALYLISCTAQPAIVFLRSFSLAVLGQMDESFATIPTGLEPISGVGESVPQPED